MDRDEYTLAEAGALIGRSSSTLRHQVQRHQLAGRLVGKTWVISRAELIRYATKVRRPVLGVTIEREETT
jgi:hypothetical protein